MSNKLKQSFREDYKRLKNALERLFKPKREEIQPRLVPVPIRNNRF